MANVDTSRPLLQSADNPGSSYHREPTISAIARDMDVMVPMRDGVKICVDVYRPEAPGKFPALARFSVARFCSNWRRRYDAAARQ